ncbi:MAG: recombinase RecT [Eubacteriales bacterium]|nr:recombinase RecT [Eubacteriales bacterium]
MAVKNSLTRKPEGIAAYLTKDAVKNQINNVIGGKNGTRFISSLVSAVNANPGLSECTSPSIVSAALLGESLNLSPSPQLGQYYMVPFNDRKNNRKVAQFQLGYKGYVQLALRSGQYRKLNVMSIKEGELIKYDPLNEEIEVNLIEDEDEREQAETVGYYAFFEYMNGFRKTMYWSKKKMVAHAEKYSMGYKAHKGYTFWEKDFDGMAYKTMLRQLISKWGIMSIDLMTAMDGDMAVIEQDGSKTYVEADDEAMVIDANETPEPVKQTAQPASQKSAPEPENSLEDIFS